jgi:SAM-dependent methyltransferase
VITHEAEQAARFFQTAIALLGGFAEPRGTMVLDFGCGSGGLVASLLSAGYDAYGCDLQAYWAGGRAGAALQDGEPATPPDRLRLIAPHPYRLPFGDGEVDVVVSTSVLEHARNKGEIFAEIRRVLRRGGCALHIFPARWYLPVEPHMYVPLANVLWPRCPAAWLALWAILGVRNEFQRGYTWRQTVEANLRFCREGLAYSSSTELRRLSIAAFGNYAEPMDFFVEHGYGGFAALARRLPVGRRAAGWFGARCRIAFVLQRKTG